MEDAHGGRHASVRALPTVSVIIPTKDRPELLADTLRSLAECDPAPDEVIVVDAGERAPGDKALAAANALAASIRWRRLTGTRGANRQRNRGLEDATGDVHVYLDDDVWLEPDAIGRLLGGLERPGVVGVTGRILEPDPRRFSGKTSGLRKLLAGRREQGTFTRVGYPNRLTELERAREVQFMSSCFMALRADVARDLRWDERLEAPSGYALADDEDFTFRLSRSGTLLYLPEARLEHRNTGFSSANQRDFNRYLVRNRAYLFRKSFTPTPAAWMQWWLVIGLHLGHRALNRDWQGLLGLLEGLRDVALRRA